VAVLRDCETVDDFVEGAVAAARDYKIAAVGGGFLRDRGGVAWAAGFHDFGFDAAGGEDAAGFVEFGAAGRAAIAGVWVVDEQGVL